MNIYGLRIEGHHETVFYAELPVRDGRGKERPTPRGWTERTFRQIKGRLLQLERRSRGTWLERVWTWLDRRPEPDEPLLRQLRTASSLEIRYPAQMSGLRARKEWKRYLGRRWRKHLVTLAWDLLVAPLVALLMILPGPNVLGYWFLYRILSHLLAMRGVWRARRDTVPTAFLASSELDAVLTLASGPKSTQAIGLARTFGLNHLSLFLSRLQQGHHRSAPEPAIAGDAHSS